MKDFLSITQHNKTQKQQPPPSKTTTFFLLRNVKKVYTFEITLRKNTLSIYKKRRNKMLTEQATILLNDAAANDITNQMTDNTLNLRLKQKYSSDTISQIHSKYDQEEQLIRDEINALEDKSGNEYEELISELKELKEEEDAEIEKTEEESNDYETHIELENAQLETRLEAIKTDNESYKECLEGNIEKSFGYFQ